MTRLARALAVAAMAAAGSAAAQAPPCFASPLRCQQMAEAEALLSRGDAAGAAQGFDRAALREHAVDIELGLLRSQLQAGEFRRALAFASHTAGAHGSDAGGSALYVWLLHASGQAAFGQRVLGQARARLPDDPRLAELQRLLIDTPAAATPALLEAPARLAPYASGVPVAAQARLVASGLLVDAGRAALVPADRVGRASRLWVRDGLGRTAQARIDRHGDDTATALLRLDPPLDVPAPPAWEAAARDAFPGSPAYAASYARRADDQPAWPWLHAGFLGGVDASGRRQQLGVGIGDGALGGGPVFDAAGRLVGLTLGDAAARELLPIGRLRADFDAVLPPTSPAAAGGRIAPDLLYERALQLTLQVLATDQ